MSSYKKDEFGEYRVPDRWIDAWTADHGFPGYCLCELREYTDGSSRVRRFDARYLNDYPEDYLAHSIYMRTRAHLERLASIGAAPTESAKEDNRG